MKRDYAMEYFNEYPNTEHVKQLKVSPEGLKKIREVAKKLNTSLDRIDYHKEKEWVNTIMEWYNGK